MVCIFAVIGYLILEALAVRIAGASREDSNCEEPAAVCDRRERNESVGGGSALKVRRRGNESWCCA